METYDETVTRVASLAREALANHELVQTRVWYWKVSQPGTWAYGFYVLMAPGALVIYGDLGEAVYRMAAKTEQDVLTWLRGAVQSPDYLMSKIANPDAYRQFYVGDSVALARETGDLQFINEVEFEATHNYLHTEHHWYKLIDEFGIDPMNFGRPVKWGPSAWWFVHALTCFMRLHDASQAAGR